MALTTINSDGVKDDSIVNADIKSDAAIALSKLASTPAVLTGSTDNTITTVTGANAIQGEANLTFDGNYLTLDTSASSRIYLTSGNSNDSSIYFGAQDDSVTGGIRYDHSDDSLRLYGHNNSERFRITSAGLVGIGATSPDTLLHLEATNTSVAVNNAIRISDADTAVVADQVCGRIEFETADTGNPGVNCQIDTIYSGSGGGGELQFRTGFAGSLVDALRIDDTGQKIVQNGKLNINSTYIDFSGSLGSVPSTAAAIYRPADNNLAFSTANTERLRILNGGDVSITDGNLVVANGHGIDFSASEGGHSTGTHASILDDYETGNFNPGISFGYGTTNLSLGTAIGSYTKIGRRVFIDFVINFSAVGDSTGYARLTALPFTASSDSRVRVHGFCSYYANMQSLTGRPTFNNSGGATTAVMYDDGTGTNTTLNETNFANNSLIRGKLEYTCA
jgi:hypothetical protein